MQSLFPTNKLFVPQTYVRCTLHLAPHGGGKRCCYNIHAGMPTIHVQFQQPVHSLTTRQEQQGTLPYNYNGPKAQKHTLSLEPAFGSGFAACSSTLQAQIQYAASTSSSCAPRVSMTAPPMDAGCAHFKPISSLALPLQPNVVSCKDIGNHVVLVLDFGAVLLWCLQQHLAVTSSHCTELRANPSQTPLHEHIEHIEQAYANTVGCHAYTFPGVPESRL